MALSFLTKHPGITCAYLRAQYLNAPVAYIRRYATQVRRTRANARARTAHGQVGHKRVYVSASTGGGRAAIILFRAVGLRRIEIGEVDGGTCSLYDSRCGAVIPLFRG